MNDAVLDKAVAGSTPVGPVRPVTVRGPLLVGVRVLWVAMAAISFLVWIVETPLLYHAAQQLHNIDGMFTVRPTVRAVGLHNLGVSAELYAVLSTGRLFLMTASMFVVGLIIFIRRSDEWIAVLVSYTFVNLGVGVINAYAGGPALVRSHPDLATPMNIYMTLTAPSFDALFLIPLVFPDGRFVPRWTWPLVPLAIFTFLPISVPDWVGLPVGLILAASVLLSPVYRYWRVSGAAQREQTKWVIFGLLTAIGAFFSLSLVRLLFPGVSATPGHRVLLELVGGSVAYLALAFLPTSFGIAILRYRLWDIDVLINRTLVYGSLTLSLVALYILGVIVLQALFTTVTGQSSDLAVAIATLGIAALFNPWRHRIQRFIDRRFYRRKYDAARTLATFSAHLRDEVNMDSLTANLLGVASDTMQPASVTLWLRDGKGSAP